MKNLKSHLLVSLISFFCVFATFAQKNTVGLTPAQKELKNNLKKTRQHNKQLFLQVLNEEQKSVFKNPSLTHKEKRKIINKSLSEAQKNELKASRIAMHNARKKFRESLSEEQKKALRNKKHHKRGNNNHKFLNIPNLTEAQKSMLKQNKEVIKANRKAFRKTFTAQQKAIIKDSTLSRSAKKKALRATFSSAQSAQFESNKKEIQTLRNTFLETLTEDQKNAYLKN